MQQEALGGSAMQASLRSSRLHCLVLPLLPLLRVVHRLKLQPPLPQSSHYFRPFTPGRTQMSWRALALQRLLLLLALATLLPVCLHGAPAAHENDIAPDHM